MRPVTTPVVRLQAVLPGGQAATVGELSIDEPLGSISSTGPDGRRVFLFGWRDDQPGVWESLAGITEETTAVRAIVSLDLERLSDLAEPFELTVWVKGQPRQMRFTASR
jgi:hypothetical protein